MKKITKMKNKAWMRKYPNRKKKIQKREYDNEIFVDQGKYENEKTTMEKILR